MKNLPGIWIDSIPSFDAAMIQIEQCLQILKENALEANFTDPNVRKKYSDDISYMKQFFERADFLIRNQL